MTDRLERLVNLVGALLDTDRLLTAAELAERIPGYPEPGGAAFHRAFERDKATLREMGVPIEVVELEPTNPESPVGYRVRRERYELPDPGLAPDEVAALHLATTQVRLEGSDATAAVWKLGGAVPTAPAVPAASLPGSDHLTPLFTAVSERRPVSFGYRGSARDVDPWRLEFRNGAWYLVGLDRGRGERRTFRLDRIDGAVASGEAGGFERPASAGGAPSRPWEMGEEDPVDVDVLIDAEQAAWALGAAGPPVETRANGDVVLRLRVTSRAGVRSWVIGFLDHAEILAPAEEREAFVAWLDR